MLIELRIRNFAIIESLSLPLEPGLNVLTGETGAGKSIIVGALGVLLGERATSDLIRAGADRAFVEGVFECSVGGEMANALDELGIEPENGTIVLRREMSATGRTRAWINDVSTTMASLARIGRLLVGIHGQHEAQSLLDGAAQRAILDDFGNAGDAAAAVREAHRRLTTIEREMSALENSRAQAVQRADYLRHVVAEIAQASLVPGEEERLEDEANRLEHADELRALAEAAAASLDGGDESVLPRIGTIQRALASARKLDPSAARFEEMLDDSYYALRELARDVATYAAAVELDPERLEQVRARRELIFRLTRKYGGSVEEVLELERRSRAELDLLATAGLDMSELARRRQQAADELSAGAKLLGELRREAAEQLRAAVDPLLPSLGMPDGRFEVALNPHDTIGPDGGETVEFQVALNVGYDTRPLSRVASGGELSRVMLALKTVLARVDRIPTLVFDEVDAGIGGRIGLQVGDTMRSVAAHHQVLAISHLPQIASRAHHHIVVTKEEKGGVTTANTGIVAGEARVREIARMLGGDPDSELSRAHARELLDSATGTGAPPASTARPSRRSARSASLAESEGSRRDSNMSR